MTFNQSVGTEIEDVHVRPPEGAVRVNFVTTPLAMGRPMTYLIVLSECDRSTVSPMLLSAGKPFFAFLQVF